MRRTGFLEEAAKVREAMATKAERTKRAPEPLILVQGLVNTRNLMRGYDLLGDINNAERWLVDSGYTLPGRTIDLEELERLRKLRERLREILLSHNLGSSAQTEEVASTLNDLVATTALGVHFDALGQPLLASSSKGTEGLVEDLLGAVVWARHTGIWQRLKVCANEECRWAFYDASKNRSGSWCVMEICGSRAKMRSYRRRHGSGAK